MKKNKCGREESKNKNKIDLPCSNKKTQE